MDIDLPEIVAEVMAAFERYEQAVVSNDVYGYDEIKRFRAARSPIGLARVLSKTVITTYGRDYAVASTLFRRDTAPGKVGRQTQTWVRCQDGWRVVVGHVSMIDDPGGS